MDSDLSLDKLLSFSRIVDNSGLWFPDSGFRFQDSGFWIRIPDSGFLLLVL